MHARTVLQNLLKPVFSSIDKRNASNLITAACACLGGRRLILMELARHWPGALRVAAPLKRLDRLLSNRQIQSARLRMYKAAIRWVVRQRQPVVIVDWSELTRDGRWQLIRASVASKGRALTVYEEVHPQPDLNSPRVHKAFLKRLKQVLPESCRPLVVTDAGFHTPWFRAVQAIGWPWMGRVRGRIKARIVSEDKPFAPWSPVRDYLACASTKAELLGGHELTARTALPCHLVRVKKPAKGRHEKRQRDQGRASSGKATKMSRSQNEPWLLACAPELSDYSARQIVKIYGLRMQIEASFRDLKSHHFGCGFEDTQTRSGARLEILLMIHMLATLMAWLAGLASVAEHETRFRLSLNRRGWEQLRKSHQYLAGRQRPPWRQLGELLACHGGEA